MQLAKFLIPPLTLPLVFVSIRSKHCNAHRTCAQAMIAIKRVVILLQFSGGQNLLKFGPCSLSFFQAESGVVPIIFFKFEKI